MHVYCVHNIAKCISFTEYLLDIFTSGIAGIKTEEGGGEAAAFTFVSCSLYVLNRVA